MNKEKKVNIQREKNFWEPIYQPEKDNVFEKWHINDKEINITTGKKNVWIDISDFSKISKKEILNFKFENIDFEGTLSGKDLRIKNCNFILCSFRNSNWSNIKFTNCNFTQTSFSLSTFKNCEFRNCNYSKIGISGNETKFDNVYIEPQNFINSAYTNTDKNVLKEFKRNLYYQKYRLENTKTIVARMLLQMKPIRNEIDIYAIAKKVARTTEIYYYMKKNIFNISTNKIFKKLFYIVKLVINIIELLFTLSIGWLSGWGLKIGRTILIGFIITIIFSLYYKIVIFNKLNYFNCYLRSLEYWFLVGYTKYSFDDIPMFNQIIIFMNSLFGMFWFGTLLPVILEKLGKSDE